MYVCTRHDIFTSCSCKAYFEINRKPLQSDKYSGYISLFIGVKMKDKFPSQRPSCPKFSQQRNIKCLTEKGEKIAKRNSSVIYSFIHFIVLHVVQVLSSFNIHT